MTKPILTICASASAYPTVIKESYTLEDAGFTVILPKTAANMKASSDSNVEAILNWHDTPDGYHHKSVIMQEHFNEIARGDAILVMNYEKHGKQNYIGPNVLMEMAIAFYLRKPIYILNGEPDDSPLIDEILGMEPTFLYGDLSRIKSA